MAKPVSVKKPIFIPGAFDDLRAAAGDDTSTGILRVRLVDIDEDPNQPRTAFDQAELQQLADTITLLGGVLQPIGVRAPVNGRYPLVFGARRYRASKMLGLADIPAIIVPEDQANLSAQVIENQSRANLTNADLAAVIVRLGEQGMKAKQIATVCGLTEHMVTMFRSLPRLPALLADRVNDGDMRAIYELFGAWQKHPTEIEAALEGHDAALSVTEARRLIEAATGRATSSIYLRGKAETPIEPPAPASEEPTLPMPLPSVAAQPPHSGEAPTVTAAPQAPHSGEVEALAPRSPPKAVAVPAASAQPAQRSGSPVFWMELADGRRGELVTTRRTGTKGLALLVVDGEDVEVPFTELRPVDVD